MKAVKSCLCKSAESMLTCIVVCACVCMGCVVTRCVIQSAIDFSLQVVASGDDIESLCSIVAGNLRESVSGDGKGVSGGRIGRVGGGGRG